MSVTYLEPFGVNTSANYTFANILVTANITNNGNVNFIGASNVNLGSNANLHITGGSSGAVLSTDGSGGLTWTSSGSVGVAGSNTQIQFNDNNSFGANANLTFNKTTKTLTVDNITANGAGLTYTTGGNVNGQVGNALIAGTVYTNAQPNITSVGSLNSLTVTGLITATGTGLKAANIQDSSGTITITTKYNSVSGDVGIYGNLNVGTSGTGFFIGDGGYISNVKSSNITGQVANALVAGTVYTNAQPNITSVGSLSVLTVSGDATVTGNFTVGGNTTYINVETFRVEDPLIELGGGVNGAALTSNDSKDRGTILHYYTTGVVDAFMGWDNSNAEFAFGSNVSVSSEVVTFNRFGNIRANYFIGNGSELTGITATTGNANYANFAGTVVNAIQSNITSVGTLINTTLGSANSFTGGNLVSATYLTGTLTTAAQPNVTSVGTLATVTHAANANVIMSGSLSQISGPNLVSANYVTTTANGNITMSGTLSRISGANLISGTYLTGTLTTAAQPNITSLGNIADLTGTGVFDLTGTSNVALGAVGNVHITGGTSGQVLRTDGSGTLSWVSISSSSISNGTSNVNIATSGGNVTVGVGGTAGVLTVTATGANISGYLNTGTGNITSGNASLGNLASANYLTGTLTTAAQPNITSLGTLTGLTSGGIVNFITSSNVSLGAVGNVKITGGSSGQVLRTDGSGVLSWVSISSSGVSNGTSNVNIATSGGNVVVGVGGTASVFTVASTGVVISGTASFSNTVTLQQSVEVLSALTGATGVVTHNYFNGAVFYHSSIAANFTPNFTNIPTTDNRIIVITLLLSQGGIPYMPTASVNVQIDSVNYAVKWPSGSAPTGIGTCIQSVSYSLIRTGAAWQVTGESGVYY